LRHRHYLVIRPPCAVSTREIFQAPELTRNTPPTTIRALFGEPGKGELRNDFEATVRRRHPPVAAALDWLSRYAPARLTGSGSCVFAAFDDASRAHEALAELPPGWQGFVARGLNRSPLLERVAQG
jgi:4-diphosphocytidyl-2-C-methyl-D-erythritol kinase